MGTLDASHGWPRMSGGPHHPLVFSRLGETSGLSPSLSPHESCVALPPLVPKGMPWPQTKSPLGWGLASTRRGDLVFAWSPRLLCHASPSSAWTWQAILRAGDVEENPGPEDYQLLPTIFSQVLRDFAGAGCPSPYVDAFAAVHNALLPRFWTVKEDAFRHDWLANLPIWANPPFSLYPRVLEKLKREGGHMLLLVPGWQAILPLFWDLAQLVYQLPPGPLFLLRGQVPMAAPHWRAFVL